MLQGAIEPLRVPHNCLDVLAQQVVACVAMDTWEVPALFELVRSAYPFQNLSPESFESILRLVSGRFPSPELRDLRARLVWDRIHNRLSALPGTAQLALVGGGTIPDTGQYPVYLGEGGRSSRSSRRVRLRAGLVKRFLSVMRSWRIEAIEFSSSRIYRATGETAAAPFWRRKTRPGHRAGARRSNRRAVS